VHAHWFIPAAIVAALAMHGTPMCVTAHGTDVLGLKGVLWRRLRQFIAARASAVTAVGKRVQDVLSTEGISPTMLLPMGVDLSGLFVPTECRPPSSRFVFVGRLVATKRPEIVLRAFAQVLKVHVGFSLDIVGNGPERYRLESLAKELGITSNLIFHGRKSQAEIAAIYRSAAAAIIASGGDEAPEGLGLVAIEALGSGCPVASVPNPALQTILPEAAPIYYARDSSDDAMAEVLLGILATPDISSQNTDSPWHKQLVQRFDWEKVANEYGRLLESLAEPAMG
jgi:glycosyltransferase involved in cell wall biosynthesis